MSGGSYDYVYYKIEDFAGRLRGTGENPRRLAFQKLLFLVANAAHDIEWVDSCDYAPGDEDEAIDKVFDLLTGNGTAIIKAEAYDGLARAFKRLEKSG